MWVRWSLKVIDSGTMSKLGYGFLFAFHSNYGRIFSNFGDTQRQRMPDLEIWVKGSMEMVPLEMAPFDRSHTSSYSPFIVTMALFCIVCEI